MLISWKHGSPFTCIRKEYLLQEKLWYNKKQSTMYKNCKQPTTSLRKVYFYSVTFEQGCRHNELIKQSLNEGGQWTHFW